MIGGTAAGDRESRLTVGPIHSDSLIANSALREQAGFDCVKDLDARARDVTGGASLRQVSRRKRDVVLGTLVLNTSGRGAA